MSGFKEWWKEHRMRCVRGGLQVFTADAAWKAATAAQREPMECGHPRACVVSDDEGTNFCAWCAEVGMLREQLAKLETVMGREVGDE